MFKSSKMGNNTICKYFLISSKHASPTEDRYVKHKTIRFLLHQTLHIMW